MDEMMMQNTLGEETEAADGGESSFEELIQGKYREDYQRKRQQEIDRRFADHRAQEERWNKWIPAMESICRQRGLDPEDAEGVTAALDGLAGEKERGEQLREWSACSALDGWVREASELGKTYPGFDLHALCGEKGFVDALKRGLTVREAYETMHRDELMMSAMEAAAQRVRQGMSAAMQSRWARPREGGLTGGSAAVSRPDAARMSRAEREAIERRALKGERIVM